MWVSCSRFERASDVCVSFFVPTFARNDLMYPRFHLFAEIWMLYFHPIISTRLLHEVPNPALNSKLHFTCG